MRMFSRKVKECKKPIEKRSIQEIIESVAHVDPMNKDSIISDMSLFNRLKKFPKTNKGLLNDYSDERYWSNPNNQTSFEHGHLSHQDFIDWANGTGIAVRGETQEQKDKYMRYAHAYDKLDLSVFIYAEHLHLIDADSKFKINYNRYNNSRRATTVIDLGIKRESAKVIKDMFSSFVQSVLNEIKYKYQWDKDYDISKYSREISDYMHAVSTTLAYSGHGYFDACNTPTELENLSWSKDLVFAKAYSLYLEETDPGLVDTIIWCQQNRYKIKS